MRILLDTHIFLWCVTDNKQLSTQTRALITNAEKVYVSSASIWEIAIKTKLGKLHADIDDLVDAISESGFINLPITAAHSAGIYALPNIHRDPFDRMLLAQAIHEPLKLLTADTKLQAYSALVEVV